LTKQNPKKHLDPPTHRNILRTEKVERQSNQGCYIVWMPCNTGNCRMMLLSDELAHPPAFESQA